MSTPPPLESLDQQGCEFEQEVANLLVITLDNKVPPLAIT
jgi:hypothetical protein